MANTKTRPATTRSRSNGQNGTNGSAAKSKSSSSQENESAVNENSQLEKFFHDQLKDIYWAEKHLTKALPKMAKATTTEDLKTAIDDHLAQTEEQIVRLEQVFELLGKKAQAKKCDAMEGLIKEGESAVEDTEDGSMTRDAAIIMASQKVEHYEIATYGSLVQLAKTMGQDEIADILQTTLDEEKETDQNLTSLAESCINYEAATEEEEEA